MKKIGLITIGQAPRTDIMEDLSPMLSGTFEIFQRGALDGLSEAELAALAPEPGDTVLVSSLLDGTAVIMAEEKILHLLQDCIDDLENKGVLAIMFLCTGDFKDSLSAEVPLIYPNRILAGLIPALCRNSKLAVLVPDAEQKEDAVRHWQTVGISAEVRAVSPYEGDAARFERAGIELKTAEADCVLLDCMGYSSAMGAQVSDICGKPVLLPRTLTAAILKEIYGGND